MEVLSAREVVVSVVTASLVSSIQPSKENSDTKEKKANRDLRLDGGGEEKVAAWRRTKDGAEMSPEQKNGDDEKM